MGFDAQYQKVGYVFAQKRRSTSWSVDFHPHGLSGLTLTRHLLNDYRGIFRYKDKAYTQHAQEHD